MPEEAAVILTAEDGISDAVNSAVSSLNNLRDTVGVSASAINDLAANSSRAGDGISLAGAAAGNCVVPTRAAHQALNLVNMELASMAGASPAASGAIHVLSSIMYSMAMTGGAVSLAFVGITAAAVGAATIFKTVGESAKKTEEELSKMSDGVIRSVQNLNTLNPSQMSVMGVAAGKLREEITKTKNTIAELTEKMSNNRDAAIGTDTAINASGAAVGNFSGGLRVLKDLYASLTGAADPLSSAQAKLSGELRISSERLRQLQNDLNNMLNQSHAYHSTLQDLGNPLTTYAAAMERAASDIEKLGRAFGNTKPTLLDWAVAGSKAAQIMKQAMGDMVAEVTDALAEMLVSGQASWDSMFAGMLKTAGAAMKQIGEMWLAMDLMVSLGVGPQSIGAAIALIAAGSVVEAVATKMTKSPAISTGAAGTASAGTPISSQSGAGGSAISTAQASILNQFTINMPIQALDLSGVTDSVLNSLANRVGRILRNAAATGQPSLAAGA